MVHNEDHLIGANREDPEYEDALASFWRRLEKERDDKKKKADKVGGKKHKKSRHHKKTHKKIHDKFRFDCVRCGHLKNPLSRRFPSHMPKPFL